MNTENANETRARLLDMINNESMWYIQMRSESRINGETAKEISSKYEIYEIVIDGPLYVGVTGRGVSIKTTLHMSTIDNDECPIIKTSDINNYINGLTKRKVLFSKYKIKNNSSKRIQNKKDVKTKLNDSGIVTNDNSFKAIKKSLLTLRRIVCKIKIIHTTQNKKNERGCAS